MNTQISTLVLAAGESRRMGRPKLLLPWGDTTVLGQVIAAFANGFTSADFQATESPRLDWEIIVVTGGDHLQLEILVQELARDYPVRAVFNPEYARSGMLSSLQAGLRALGPSAAAALVGLGDQPQLRPETIRNILSAYLRTHAPLVVPSFQQRRGHPWLVARSHWPEMLSLPASATSRQFLQTHSGDTEYVPADESILQDLDTPEEYGRLRP